MVGVGVGVVVGVGVGVLTINESHKPGIRVYLSMQTLPGAAISINWPLVLKRSNESGNVSPNQNYISITKP